MIKVKCMKCGRELEEAGSIYLTSPSPNMDLLTKYHLCLYCEAIFLEWIKTDSRNILKPMNFSRI